VNLTLLKRKLKLVKFILFPGSFREDLKLKVNLEYRRYLAAKNGIKEINVENLLDWDSLDLKLSRPSTSDGQTSKLELLILVGFAKSLKDGENFLEIGTYDGNTALNCAINLSEHSKFITVDLPEGADQSSQLEYDAHLINNPKRMVKRCSGLSNVQQIYEDSTRLDFSELDFNMAFIDGGHDYQTVKSDSLNVLQYIKSPGVVLWHDYDVECPVGDCLHELAAQYDICKIKGTRICMARVG